MRELTRSDHFNRLALFAEWHKKVNDAFRYANLLALLMDVDSVWIEKKNLGVGEFLLGRFWLIRL